MGHGHWRSVEEHGNEVEGQKDIMGVYVHFQVLSSEFDWQTLPTRPVRLEIATGRSRQYGTVQALSQTSSKTRDGTCKVVEIKGRHFRAPIAIVMLPKFKLVAEKAIWSCLIRTQSTPSTIPMRLQS